MAMLPIRLGPGDDLRHALEAALRTAGGSAAFVVAGIGSLGTTKIRYAGADDATSIAGDVEILTLAGSLGEDHSHPHGAVADAGGRVSGGHAAYGCIVRTTAEILVALLPGWRFTREPDARTGYDELVARPDAQASPMENR